jgi:hypothetical protein
MSMVFKDLQDEVKHRATKDQGGTTFDTPIKTIINTSLFRIGREAPWRSMRRKSFFDTVPSYTTGVANATTSSVNVTFATSTLITNSIQPGRRIDMSGDGDVYTIRTISSETALTIDKQWGASTTTNMTFEIYPQTEYNLPIQAGHRMFMWHEDYGYPYQLEFVTDQEFINYGYDLDETGTPLRYRMWGENMVMRQPSQATSMSVFSSAAGDVNISVTIFGISGGYPAYEIITTNASNGASAVTGGVVFSSVERIAKSATSAGRIGVYCDASTSTTVAVMPMGDTTAGILYKKVQIHPCPDHIFPINVQYYKDPYRLVNDGDIHELGQDFDEAIILLSVSKIKGETEQAGAGSFYQMWQDEIRSLRRTNMDKMDWFPKLERPAGSNRDRSVRPNLLYRQVGPNFGSRSR